MSSADAKSFVERLIGPVAEEPLEGPAPEAAACFRAVPETQHPPSMLMLRFRDGNAKAIGYAYLIDSDFNPSVGITLSFVGHRVTVQGRHLDRLFDKLGGHRVEWIREVDERTVTDERLTVVSRIHVTVS